MKANEIMNGVTRTLNKVGFKLKKHSPEILIAAGVVGTVTSAVMACKATTKAGEIIDDMQEDMKKINEVVSMENVDYTEEDHKKDTVIVYSQTAVKLVKLYAPSVALGMLSIGCMLASNNILRKRNVALAAAYTTIDTSFKEYRKRVVDRFGKEVENEIRYNIKAKEFEETVVDEKTGKETTVKNTVNIVDPNTYSDYARFFDDGCTGWCKDPESNLTFLKCQQAYANDILKAKGHLFLNEVYDLLGIPRTKAGQVVGWVYDEKNPVGDNFVDFGFYNSNIEKCRDFVNGYERTILLDFNVDGNILDLM